MLHSFINGALFDTLYVFSPVFGFLPQIYSGNITYNPLLCLLTIVASVFKLFSSKDAVLSYQFAVAIALHLYLLGAKMKNQKDRPLSELANWRAYSRNAVLGGIVLLFVLLRAFESIGFIYAKVAVALELSICMLHLKFYTKQGQNGKPKELFVTWVVGDIIRLIVLLKKYDCPVDYVVGVLIQIAINGYVLFT